MTDRAVILDGGTSPGAERFTSRWGLVAAALGMAVGTGNIWRFPRVAAANGGGAFLIPWILALFLWSIPLLMVEFALGKTTRRGTIGAFATAIGDRFAWMGGFVGFCTLAILFYYSVVAGWCLRYFLGTLTGAIAADPESFWISFTGGQSVAPVLFHALAVGLGALIVGRGIVRGIELANKILLPALFILLAVAALRAVTLDGASRGLECLFNPDLSRLADYRVWLEALTQSAWSTGAGWGLVLTYACYMRRDEDIVLNSVITGLGNNSASLLAAIAIVPTVFAFLPVEKATDVMNQGNNGLAFIYLPQLFAGMAGGRFFSAVFFLALSVAAISSLIAMFELGVRLAMDMGLSRIGGLSLIASVTFVAGLPSALWMSVFDNQDWVWGVGLMVSGLFVAFAAWRYGADRFRRECINAGGSDLAAGRWFNVVIRLVIPLEFAAMILWWFYKSITTFDRDGWWNPLHTSSVGTCVVQWGIVLALLLTFNSVLSRRSRA
ncbi:MAG: sodium-dependent transporter [Acidobacteriota bacterium]